MDTSFHASENDFIWEDCGKCLKSRSCLGRHRLRQHLKQEMKFKCITDSCPAAFCETIVESDVKHQKFKKSIHNCL
jgi:hypothetical protein